MKKDLRNKKIPTNRGQAMLIAVMFFLAGGLIVLGGVVSPVLKDVKTVRNIEKSKQSNYLAESGVEDVVYRIKNSMNYSEEEYLKVNGIIATTTNQVVAGKREVTSVGDRDSIIRTIKAVVLEGAVNESFVYVLQAESGGAKVNDSAYITGDVFSNFEIIGENTNTITGNAVSAGPNGLIENIHITGDAYAHTIRNSTIDDDAYYQIISGSSVGGTTYPGSSDQPISTMTISDSDIDNLKANAQDGGTISSPCPYIINSNTTIGPKKINCDLEIIDNANVTLMGNIWVVGDITIKNFSNVKIDPSLGSESIAIIADNPSDREESSTISIKNSAVLQGSGSNGSHIVAISRNNSAENGGSDIAIEVKNSASGDLFVYAPYGFIQVKNSADFKGLAGYKVEIKNSAHLGDANNIINIPSTGDSNGGGFSLESWLEI